MPPVPSESLSPCENEFDHRGGGWTRVGSRAARRVCWAGLPQVCSSFAFSTSKRRRRTEDPAKTSLTTVAVVGLGVGVSVAFSAWRRREGPRISSSARSSRENESDHHGGG